MAKTKEHKDDRALQCTKEAFFNILEDFLHSLITGSPLSKPYTAIIPLSAHAEIWERANYVAADDRADENTIILSYQNSTITQLHQLGHSYRVIDRDISANPNQMSLFDEAEDVEDDA